jgi:hypothetical protein
MDAVELVDPAGQAYPDVQGPVQAAVVRPVVVPKTPAGHGAVHDAVVRPCVEPYRPAAQGMQDPDPAVAYCPARHWEAVALVDLAGQAYPAMQLPLHAADVKPMLAP